MIEHAIAIARVSAGTQHEEDQRPGLVKYAERKGYVLEEVVPVHGRSAFHGKHVKQILTAVDRHVRNGNATVVIFRHVDRSSREGVFKGIDLLNKIMAAGARIEFSEQEFLNNNPGWIGPMLELAKEESKIKQDRKLQGNAKRRAAGQLIGRAPWGYDPVLDDKGIQVNIKPNDLGRLWIPEIFNAVINGKSLRAVAEMLKGIPSPQANGLWNEASIRRIIGNTTYYGAMKNNPFMSFEPFVKVEVYKQANTAVYSRLKRGRAVSASRQEPVLAKPFCGACWGNVREGAPSGKSPMYRSYRGQWVYYNCKGHGPARKSCGGPGIPVASLDAVIEEKMSTNASPHMVRVPVAGDDNDEQRELIKEKISAAQAANDFALIATLSQEAMEIGPSERKSRVEERDSGITVGQHWQTLTRAEKRDELVNWTIIAGMNDGEVYTIIDRPGAYGLRILDVSENLPGPTLLQQAWARGTGRIVDAEAALDD